VTLVVSILGNNLDIVRWKWSMAMPTRRWGFVKGEVFNADRRVFETGNTALRAN
jgi:hypothetical protein